MTHLPMDIRNKLRSELWERADSLGWSKLSDIDRAVWYENWAKDRDVGGVLGHFIDPRRVRVYIKDSLMKPYQKHRLGEMAATVLQRLDISSDERCIREFEKPHGRVLSNGKVVCWGNVRDWKSVVMATFERASSSDERCPYGLALLDNGRNTSQDMRQLIDDARRRLGIERLAWLD